MQDLKPSGKNAVYLPAVDSTRKPKLACLWLRHPVAEGDGDAPSPVGQPSALGCWEKCAGGGASTLRCRGVTATITRPTSVFGLNCRARGEERSRLPPAVLTHKPKDLPCSPRNRTISPPRSFKSSLHFDDHVSSTFATTLRPDRTVKPRRGIRQRPIHKLTNTKAISRLCV